LVDANNLLSVRLRLPLGIYDLARVPLQRWTYRLGFSGETYRTFAQQEKNAVGKMVLADCNGIFGSPVTDSGRASINADSNDIAVMAYLPRGMALEEAAEILEEVESTFQAWFVPDRAECQVVSPYG
jgi:DNA/RNA-binding domain of Phe-tRNA-synthetase-like protein